MDFESYTRIFPHISGPKGLQTRQFPPKRRGPGWAACHSVNVWVLLFCAVLKTKNRSYPCLLDAATFLSWALCTEACQSHLQSANEVIYDFPFCFFLYFLRYWATEDWQTVLLSACIFPPLISTFLPIKQAEISCYYSACFCSIRKRLWRRDRCPNSAQ